MATALAACGNDGGGDGGGGGGDTASDQIILGTTDVVTSLEPAGAYDLP